MDQQEAPIDREMLRKLEAAVGSMPREQREVFLAHRLDNMTYREIAEVTGFTTRKVERYMAKALVHLAKCMDSHSSPHRAGLLGRVPRLLTKIFGGAIAPLASKNGQDV